MNQLPPIRPDFVPDAGQPLRLCAAEMWSFVRCKKGQRWRWWGEDVATGYVLAFGFGRRTHATFRRLLTVLAQAGWAVADGCLAGVCGVLAGRAAATQQPSYAAVGA